MQSRRKCPTWSIVVAIAVSVAHGESIHTAGMDTCTGEIVVSDVPIRILGGIDGAEYSMDGAWYPADLWLTSRGRVYATLQWPDAYFGRLWQDADGAWHGRGQFRSPSDAAPPADDPDRWCMIVGRWTIGD